jgi:peptidoglycan biosynthesis protein MviN/MurJ (putative lipid II flippase)
MSTQTLTLGAKTLAAETGPAKAEPVAAETNARKARAGMAMSIATFAMAAASGIQAILYLGRFGTNARTDGFFVAFALYSTFGVFSQSLRVTSVPLLVEPGARLSFRRFASVLACVAVGVLVLTVPLAGPLAQVLAPGLSHAGRSVTAAALPVLGVAMALQLWASGGATLLAIRDRFLTIAGAYISGALAGLVTFLALMGSAGVQTLGWSMFAMSVVTCGWMLIGVQRSGGMQGGAKESAQPPARGALAGLVRDGALVLGRTAIYLAFNVLFVVTLAFASHAASGGTTVLSYAYLFASYLVAGTGMALGMSSIPDMTREARTQGRAVVAATVPRGFRYAMLIVAPAMGVLIVCGAPLVHDVLPHSLSAAQVVTLRTFTALLVPWTLAALLVNFLLPVLLALGRARLLGLLALPLVLVHLAATVLGSALFGVDGAVGAFFVAPALLGGVLLVAGTGRAFASALARELSGDAARFIGLSLIAFGIGWTVSIALHAGLVQAALAGVIGSCLYLGGLRIVARPQLETLLRAVAARPAAA